MRSFTVLRDFDAALDTDLTVREGEIVERIDSDNTDWWLVQNKQNQRGEVPSNFLEVCELYFHTCT